MAHIDHCTDIVVIARAMRTQVQRYELKGRCAGYTNGTSAGYWSVDRTSAGDSNADNMSASGKNADDECKVCTVNR